MNLDKLFSPRSIAIVGASGNLDSIGGQPIKLAKDFGYTGKIFPINPKYDTIAGYTCYKSLLEIEEPVDMALLAVAARRVPEVLRQCVAKKIRFVDIFSSGFAEAGDKSLQEELLSIIKGSETRILGPNNQGVVNFLDKIPAGFNPLLQHGIKVVPGEIAVIAQSSGLGFGLIGVGTERGLRFSHIATVGNQVDIGAHELLDFMLDEPRTKIVACILEGLREGEDWFKLAAKAKTKGKQLVFLKLGRTEAGQKASASHSGSLASNAEIFSIFCRQSGAILVKDFEELVDILVALQAKPLHGKRLCIVTETGGAGIMAADMSSEYGLALPSLHADPLKHLRNLLPSFASLLNPVDVTAQIISAGPEMFGETVITLAKDPNIDILLFSLGPAFGELGEALGKYLLDASKNIDKPIFISWISPAQPIMEKLRAAEVPVYPSPQRCLRAISHLAGHRETALQTSPSKTASGPAGSCTVHALSEYQSKQLLKKYGIPIPRGEMATSPEQSLDIFRKLGGPAVMKLVSPQITHKTDAGLVALNICDEHSVKTTHTTLVQRAKAYSQNAVIEGVLVEEMLHEPVAEVMIGIKNDKNFGPVLITGLGGIFVELIRDVAKWILPLTEEQQVQQILASLKSFPLLNGYRGKPHADIHALSKLLIGVSNFAMDHQNSISEMDINPVFVFEEGYGCVAADAVIIEK